METDRFDALVRSLTGTLSRRSTARVAFAALGSVLAMAGAEAKPKKGKGKKKKRKKPACRAACCADADCGPRNRCLRGRCVTWQGTCAAGANSCDAFDIACNGKPGCKCFEAAAGETRCGMVPEGIQCGQCTTDAGCAAFGPGAFCVTDTVPFGNCSCGFVGEGFCIVPCDRVCPATGCCLDADCSPGQICSLGRCLNGRGTCPVGANVCTGTSSGTCNSNATCDCFFSPDSGTRCGGAFVGPCGGCTSDSDCAAHGAGAFCAATGNFCCTGGASGNRCTLPCPT